MTRTSTARISTMSRRLQLLEDGLRQRMSLSGDCLAVEHFSEVLAASDAITALCGVGASDLTQSQLTALQSAGHSLDAIGRALELRRLLTEI